MGDIALASIENLAIAIWNKADYLLWLDTKTAFEVADYLISYFDTVAELRQIYGGN